MDPRLAGTPSSCARLAQLSAATSKRARLELAPRMVDATRSEQFSKRLLKREIARSPGIRDVDGASGTQTQRATRVSTCRTASLRALRAQIKVVVKAVYPRLRLYACLRGGSTLCRVRSGRVRRTLV